MSLIESLQDKSLYNHPVEEFRVLETHISWVLLTGSYAYKLKKHVDMGFVNFSTLSRREKYCYEELRLNRRLAPELYLDVLPITGSEESPQINGAGEIIDYAVQMVQFDQENLLSHAIDHGTLIAEHIELLAQEVAEFHGSIAVATNDSEWGEPEAVMAPVQENIRHLREIFSSDPVVLDQVALIEAENESWCAEHQRLLKQRKEQGFVRECHGDMHLNNMILSENGVTIFDCLEFNAALRWVDVMSEVAFVVMDLEDRGRRDFSMHFLNHYLELTGDYAGVPLLKFYLSYRAMVRAKVAALRYHQHPHSGDEATHDLNEFHTYLDLATQYVQKTESRLMLNHGVSGSGKSYGSRLLLDGLPAICIRSDVERKRLQVDGSLVDSEIYSKENTHKTYQRLHGLSQSIVEAGWSVIVDATTLKKWQRSLFRELAEQLGVPFHVLCYTADEEVLKSRIVARLETGEDPSDATVAVLERQLSEVEPLEESESVDAVLLPANQEWTPEMLVDLIVGRSRGSS